MANQLITLLRLPNLLMLAGIQYLVFYRLSDHRLSVMSSMDITLLIIITTLIGASGYVINDFYDTEIDKINKPKKWIAGNTLSMSMIKRIYIAIVILGFILSVWLALRINLLKFIFIYPVAVTALWFYSYALKCKAVIGNIWVAVFCAAVIAVVFLPDIIFNQAHIIKEAFWYYLLFAFIATWFREVVKDIEDHDGDAAGGCKTLPVVAGIKFAKWMAIGLGIALLVSMLIWDTRQSHRWINLLLNVVQGFSVAAMAMVWWAKSNAYYHHASTIIKLMMIGGTLVLFFV